MRSPSTSFAHGVPSGASSSAARMAARRDASSARSRTSMPLASASAWRKSSRRQGGAKSISPPFQGTVAPPVASAAANATIASSIAMTSR